MSELPKPPSRFNPWPWSIVGVFALAIPLAVAFVIFCIRHPSELVTPDYYEKELLHQGRVESRERARQLAGAVEIAYDVNAGNILVRLPEAHASLRPAGEIRLYRPSAADWDRTLPLAVDAAGRQEVQARDLPAGLWRVTVHWTVGGETYEAESPLVIPGKA
ncbi:MAG: FixH family protein [Limisphaerales bacterium]